jgi:AbrB family looped-hinge helix DNA binding protein
MPTVVTVDRTGRILIPKKTRTAQRLRAGTKFLLVEGRGGRIWLQRLDPDELAAQIRREIGGVDLEPIVAKVEADVERLAEERYAAVARR